MLPQFQEDRLQICNVVPASTLILWFENSEKFNATHKARPCGFSKTLNLKKLGTERISHSCRKALFSYLFLWRCPIREETVFRYVMQTQLVIKWYGTSSSSMMFVDYLANGPFFYKLGSWVALFVSEASGKRDEK
jgi:hypothetical protein